MRVYRSADPLADFNRKSAEEEAWLRKRPTCCECGEHIQEETAYYNGTSWICEACYNAYERETVEDYT